MSYRSDLFAAIAVIVLTACATSPSPQASPAATSTPVPVFAPAAAPDIAARRAKLPEAVIDYDRGLLDETDRTVLSKLIEACRYLDPIFLRQVSEENAGVRRELELLSPRSPLHRQALLYFDAMRGRWDRLRDDEPFVAPFGPEGRKPPGAGLYPKDLTKAEFETWVKAHPEDKADFQSTTTVIRREGEELVAIPYSTMYEELLVPATIRLEEAATLTRNRSLSAFLLKRSKALLDDDYYESEISWMDLDGPVEITIGPYEVYEDRLLGYKASFEAFIGVVDGPESERLSVYAAHLPDMERNLPIPDEDKNPHRGTESPIRVVQEAFEAGEARAGVQTSAFNLPNDERVRQARGSKKILMKNVMEAKFTRSGRRVAERMLDEEQLPLVSFDAYFTHTLFHELSHGLGPGLITGPDGQRVDNRILLKDLYSTIEECKADVVGVWSLLWALDRKLVTSFDERALLATDAALMFRSMRFGLGDAHGGGTAVQWNWYREKGAVVPAAGGRFRVDFGRAREAVRSLANELLMIEATGDYARGQRLLERYGRSTPEIEAGIARVGDVPVDITPVFPAAGEKIQAEP